jgi:hypothetical protein
MRSFPEQFDVVHRKTTVGRNQPKSFDDALLT